jgi:Skp family chaperone for outer membrane proteins
MKTIFATALLALALAASSFAAPQWRIATVDLDKVFSAHPKTAAAEAELKNQEAALEAEMKELADDIKSRRAELDQAREAARSPLLSDEARTAKRAAIDEKETALEELLLRAKKTQASKLRQLQEQLLQTRQGIVDEMQESLQKFADSQGYALILDKSGLTMNGVPTIAYSRASLDVTAALIKYIQTGTLPAAAPSAAASNE